MREATTFQIPYLQSDAQRVTFENGHTLVFVPKQGDVFNVSTWVKTGSIHEDDLNNGVSHFLEHLMFKGTERFKPGEFDRAMESMGAIINAATWKDFTYYYISGPNGQNGECFSLALDMHADMLLHSTLPDEEIGPQYNPDDPNYAGEKRERSVVIEEIGMREDQPWTKVYNSVNRLMYPEGHPYRRDVIGTRQIIGNIPRASIQDYYRRWYAPETMTTIVVGDFDFEDIKAQVRKTFDFAGPSATPPAVEARPDSPFDGALEGAPRREIIEGQYQTSFCIMGYHGPAVGDLRETIALDIASYVLGEGRSSRLIMELLEKAETPNFNSISCGQSTFRLGNVFYIQGNFLSPDLEASLGEIHAEIDKLLDSEPITEDEFRRAVKKLKVDFAETSETAAGIAESIGEALTVSDDLAGYTGYLEVLESLDLETVRTVAKKYLSPEKAFTSVLVPQNA
jgi:zinc protease